MSKASLTLPNGTVVQIEGTPEEVRQLLDFYSGKANAPQQAAGSAGRRPPRKPKETPPSSVSPGSATPDLNQIVNLVKNSDEAEAIETNVLDRSSQVDRTLLPLYIIHEHLKNAFGLSSGEINKITTELGVPVSQPNASSTLSGTAARYVIGDKVRKKGQPVRYKLSRRGLQYMKAVIAGSADEDES